MSFDFSQLNEPPEVAPKVEDIPGPKQFTWTDATGEVRGPFNYEELCESLRRHEGTAIVKMPNGKTWRYR